MLELVEIYQFLKIQIRFAIDRTGAEIFAVEKNLEQKNLLIELDGRVRCFLVRFRLGALRR